MGTKEGQHSFNLNRCQIAKIAGMSNSTVSSRESKRREQVRKDFVSVYENVSRRAYSRKARHPSLIRQMNNEKKWALKHEALNE